MSESNSQKALPVSPLLNSLPPKAQSTINLNKLDKSRFTNFSNEKSKNKETNSLRIIIYVVIVIIVGVGSALLARQLMNLNNSVANNEDNTTKPTVDNVPSYIAIYNVDSQLKQDNLASNLPKNDDFKTASLLTLGTSSVNMSNAILSKINYTAYTTFSRLSFDFTTEENKIPKTNASYDASKDTLTLEFVGLKNIATELKLDKTINGLVTSIKFDLTTKKYTLQFKQTTVYKLFGVEDMVYVDLRTEDEYSKQIALANAQTQNSNTTNTTNTNANSTQNNTSTSTDTAKPASRHYTNEFSQNTQYVSSAVKTKSVGLNNYYTWDEGSFFEFSFAEEKKIGDDYIPNAKAYLKEESSKQYIFIEIENLNRVTLSAGITSAEIQTKTGINMANTNFVALALVSFDQATGKAVYSIELKQKANFKLLTQETYSGDTQILSVQIKD